MNENFLLNDTKMNSMIEDIVDIFNNVEGVELVRLSGLSKRCKRIANLPEDFPDDTINKVVKKLKFANVINYLYITQCPHCNEISYQILEPKNMEIKLCDTCKTMYNLISNVSIYK